MTGAAARFFVVTGGPGSGKTTLLAALAGRATIRDQMMIARQFCVP